MRMDVLCTCIADQRQPLSGSAVEEETPCRAVNHHEVIESENYSRFIKNVKKESSCRPQPRYKEEAF